MPFRWTSRNFSPANAEHHGDDDETKEAGAKVHFESVYQSHGRLLMPGLATIKDAAPRESGFVVPPYMRAVKSFIRRQLTAGQLPCL